MKYTVGGVVYLLIDKYVLSPQCVSLIICYLIAQVVSFYQLNYCCLMSSEFLKVYKAY